MQPCLLTYTVSHLWAMHYTLGLYSYTPHITTKHTQLLDYITTVMVHSQWPQKVGAAEVFSAPPGSL